MSNEQTKLKRALGFSASYGAAVGLVVSGTAMFSVSSVAASAGHATFISAAIGMIPMMVAAFAPTTPRPLWAVSGQPLLF